MNCHSFQKKTTKTNCRSIWTVSSTVSHFSLTCWKKNATKRNSHWNVRKEKKIETRWWTTMSHYFRKKKICYVYSNEANWTHRRHHCRHPSCVSTVRSALFFKNIQWTIFPKISHKLPFIHRINFSAEGNCFSHSSFDTFLVGFICASHTFTQNKYTTPIDSLGHVTRSTTDFHNISFCASIQSSLRTIFFFDMYCFT